MKPQSNQLLFNTWSVFLMMSFVLIMYALMINVNRSAHSNDCNSFQLNTQRETEWWKSKHIIFRLTDYSSISTTNFNGFDDRRNIVNFSSTSDDEAFLRSVLRESISRFSKSEVKITCNSILSIRLEHTSVETTEIEIYDGDTIMSKTLSAYNVRLFFVVVVM